MPQLAVSDEPVSTARIIGSNIWALFVSPSVLFGATGAAYLLVDRMIKSQFITELLIHIPRPIAIFCVLINLISTASSIAVCRQLTLSGESRRRYAVIIWCLLLIAAGIWVCFDEWRTLGFTDEFIGYLVVPIAALCSLLFKAHMTRDPDDEDDE